MKLQNKKNRTVNDKTYWRWHVNLSKEMVDDLEWKKGQNLKSKISGNRLVIEPEK